MAKSNSVSSNRIRRTPAKKVTRSVTSSKIFKKKASESICIKAYKFENISGLKACNSYSNFIEYSVMCMVVVILLCQLRSLRPDSSSAKLDQLPSFRYYKKRVTLDTPGQALSLALATSLPEAIVFLPDNPDELEDWMLSAMESYVGNEKFIERCSPNNVIDFVCGNMSRILGYLNSCPASSMHSFNVDSSVLEWSVQDVVNRMAIPESSNIRISHIIERLRVECFELPQNPVTFAEPPFSGTHAIEGGCKLEKEIFGKDMPIRLTKPDESPSGLTSGFTDEQLSKLSSLERRKLEAAFKVGKKDLISKYQRIILQRSTEPETAISEPPVSVRLQEKGIS